jgi:DNA-binding HxlR family transcriptional regulator
VEPTAPVDPALQARIDALAEAIRAGMERFAHLEMRHQRRPQLTADPGFANSIGLSRSLSGLERRGLVRRSGGHGRSTVRLTSAGWNLALGYTTSKRTARVDRD